jgi:phage shock protein PspC (stress-responsive transcriptional regulator)
MTEHHDLPPAGPTAGFPTGSSTLPPPRPFRLLRARHDVLGGVCAGIAAATGLDVTLVRLAFVAAGLAGFGIIAYLVLWVVVPREDPAAGRFLTTAPPDTARWIKVALLVGAILGLGSVFSWPFGWGDPDGGGAGFLLGVILIAAGAGYLWSQRRNDTAPMATGAYPVSATSWAPPAPATSPLPITEPYGAGAAHDTSGAGYGSPASPGGAVPTRQRLGAGAILAKVVGWFVIVTVPFVVVGVGFLVSIGALSMRLPVLAGALVLTAFVVLVATTAGSRVAWPILASLALLLGAGVLSAGLIEWDRGVGERIDRPATVADVRSSYELAAGRRVVDLSRLDLPEGQPVAVVVDQGVGEVEVIVPDGSDVAARVHVGAGEARVLGEVRNGLDVDLVQTATTPPADVDIDVDLGAGAVTVCRASQVLDRQLACP